jgi:hypothetical protein
VLWSVTPFGAQTTPVFGIAINPVAGIHMMAEAIGSRSKRSAFGRYVI